MPVDIYKLPAKAAEKILEIARTIEPCRDNRIHTEKVSVPFKDAGGTINQYSEGVHYLIARKLIEMHPSHAYFKLVAREPA